MADTPTSGRRAVPAAVLFLLLYLIWGFTYVALRIGLAHAAPLTFAAGRALLGGVVVAAAAAGARRPFPRRPDEHRFAALVGLGNVTALAGLMSVGAARVSAGETSILIYTQPLYTALLAWLWLREPLTSRRIGGLLAGFTGMTLVLADRVRPGAHPDWGAYMALVGGGLGWALSAVYYRKRQTEARRRGEQQADFLWLTAFQAFYGSIPLMLGGLLLESWHVEPVLDFWWTLLYSGVFASGVANVLWFHLLNRREAVVVGAYVFFVPVFAVIFGALLLGEHLPPPALVGGLLIVTGIFLVNSPTKRPTPPSQLPLEQLHHGRPR